MKGKKMNLTKSGVKPFATIKSKIVVMGVFAIAASAVVGVVGINSINRNFKYNAIESSINDLNMLHKQNQIEEANYHNYATVDYLERVVANLGEMSGITSKLNQMAENKYNNDVQDISGAVQKSLANYSEIQSLSSERGFTAETGLFQQYKEASVVTEESFAALMDKPEWMEIEWMEGILGETGEPVTVDGKDYLELNFSNPVPLKAKRNSMSFRIGGTLTYDGDVYITNIRWRKGNDVLPSA